MSKKRTGSKTDLSRKGALIRILAQRDADEFNKIAQTFTSEATASQKSALDTLFAIGTHTRSGKLTKRFQS